jgi:hypothetical protein
MHIAMSEEEDHSSNIFGIDMKQPRSTMKLVDHVREYSKRKLSYPSDALNALRGLFSSFAKGDHPTKQFWGIPIHTTGYNWHP